jgi:hypothetical protein
VFVGYIDEHGEEREAAYPCRRCATRECLANGVCCGYTSHQQEGGSSNVKQTPR